MVALLLLLVSNLVSATLPPTLNYQGHLTDGNGAPIDGVVNIAFRIYDVDLGGLPLWTDNRSVNVQQGVFSIELGDSTSPFPVGLFETPLWIGISIETDNEMTPRRPITSAGYAFKAGDANTLDGSSVSSLDQSAHVADTGNPHNVTASQTGAVTATEFGNHTANSSAHHTRYSNAEAVAAMGVNNDANPLHHDKYTDTRAVKAILLADGPGSTLDADTLDGFDSGAFMPFGTDVWVNNSGDTMTGDLILSGASRLGIGVASAAYPLHVNGEVKFGNTINFGSAESFIDAGANTIGTGLNSLQVGGKLTVAAVVEANSGIMFADGTTQTTAANTVQNRIFVAKSGGDYLTIQAAIDAATPSATNPYIIEVAPGTYTESVVMKSYINLKGSGPDQTIIIPDTSSPSSDQDFTAIWMDNLQGVRVSGFTLYGGKEGVEAIGAIGVRDIASSPVIENMRITGFLYGGIFGAVAEVGIYSTGSSPQVYNSEINEGGTYGILLELASAAKVVGNTFLNNTGDASAHCAVTMNGSDVLVTSNYFYGNGAPICATHIGATQSTVTISSNRLIENPDGIRLTGNVIAEIIGNHISTSVVYGTGIYGSDIHRGTRIIGNTVIGTENGIITPAAAVIIGNHVQASCPGGCNSIWYMGTDSEVIGNYSNYGYGTDQGARIKTDGYMLTSETPDDAGPPGPGKDIILQVGNARVVISQNGDISIEADGDLSLVGTNISIQATNAMDIASAAAMTVDAGLSLDIGANLSTSISAGAELDLTGAIVDVNGGQITLN